MPHPWISTRLNDVIFHQFGYDVHSISTDQNRDLIRDNDNKFGTKFSAAAKSSGIEELKTPFQAPKANARGERLIGSLKRECLDHFLIFNQYQLKRIIIAYAEYYNQHRAHQGIKQRIPAKPNQPRPELSNQVKGKVVATHMISPETDSLD